LTTISKQTPGEAYCEPPVTTLLVATSVVAVPSYVLEFSSSLPVHPSLIHTYFIHSQPVTVQKIHKDLGVIMSMIIMISNHKANIA